MSQLISPLSFPWELYLDFWILDFYFIFIFHCSQQTCVAFEMCSVPLIKAKHCLARVMISVRGRCVWGRGSVPCRGQRRPPAAVLLPQGRSDGLFGVFLLTPGLQQVVISVKKNCVNFMLKISLCFLGMSSVVKMLCFTVFYIFQQNVLLIHMYIFFYLVFGAFGNVHDIIS